MLDIDDGRREAFHSKAGPSAGIAVCGPQLVNTLRRVGRETQVEVADAEVTCSRLSAAHDAAFWVGQKKLDVLVAQRGVVVAKAPTQGADVNLVAWVVGRPVGVYENVCAREARRAGMGIEADLTAIEHSVL